MGCYVLKKSTRTSKKYMVRSPQGGLVHFGAVRPDGTFYEDYTKHKDIDRKTRYIQRHRGNENWGISGIHTAGFWARWILWNKPSLKDSITDTEKRFGICISRQ